jgi:hypothetical protein
MTFWVWFESSFLVFLDPFAKNYKLLYIFTEFDSYSFFKVFTAVDCDGDPLKIDVHLNYI